ncbi:hypothetical protein [Rhizobium sp. IY2]|uniref:hypothetical protein n=1 Tax=Rhizobium sp. IY2 TaxID=3397853 RepID=UPI0039DF81EE
MSVIRAFVGDFSNEEVLAWIDEVLLANENLKPKGIRVSNSLHTRGIEGTFREVPIAMSPGLYPDDQVEVVFEADEGAA